MIPINPNTYIQLLFKNKLKPIETGVPEQDVDRELEQELHPGHQEGTHTIIGVCLFVIFFTFGLALPVWLCTAAAYENVR